MMTERPKVSVLMITYNHEAFIAQAIESVLMQVADFDYELVISEDCSTDSTREIVQGYQKSYPDRIRLFLTEQNIGYHRNLLETYRVCRGEYIAILEGDDYWTDPNKLQTQADIMDADPEVVICGHNVALKREDGSTGPDYHVPKGFNKSRMYMEDMFAAQVPFCSLMLRSTALQKVPVDRPWGHRELLTYVSAHGAVEYREEIMATYRMHNTSLWNPLNPLVKFRAGISLREGMDDYFDYKYHSQIAPTIERLWLNIAAYYADQAATSGTWAEPLSFLLAEMNERPNRVDDAVQKRVIGYFWVNLGFASYTSHQGRRASACMLRAFKSNPAYLRNRGAWAVAVKGMWPARNTSPTEAAATKSP